MNFMMTRYFVFIGGMYYVFDNGMFGLHWDTVIVRPEKIPIFGKMIKS